MNVKHNGCCIFDTDVKS